MKNQKPVFILSYNGEPLMPSYRYGMIRKKIKSGDAKIIKHNPFTVQLQNPTKEYKQIVSAGIDPPYKKGGYSVIANGKELIGGEFEQRTDIPDLLKDRSKHRKGRRGRKRYRKPRFENRKKSALKLKKGDEILLKENIEKTSFKKHDIVYFSHKEDNFYIIYNSEGEYARIQHKKNKQVIEKTEKCLPPSLNHNRETVKKMVEKLKAILPITHLTIEEANFDIQKIKNPEIKNEEYQQGEQLGFFNVRQYVLHRDNYKCQNPDCKNKNQVLRVHHIVYEEEGGTDKPSNLVTLCTKCHTPNNHKKGGFLYKLMQEGKKMKGYKGATFISIITKNMVNDLKRKYPDINIKRTFGYITKSKRIELKKQASEVEQNNFEKTHHNDAFFIAGGTTETRVIPTDFEQIRRNNRSLTNFFDAKYIDSRDGSIKTGNELNSGRTTKNKKWNTENLRKFRKQKATNKQGKVLKGYYTNTKQKRPAEKGTVIKITECWEGKKVFENNRKNFVKKGEVYVSQGCNENQVSIIKENIKFKIPLKFCKSIYFQKGLVPKQLYN